MTILVQQLRERALKATPGPWQHERLGIIQGGPMQTYVNGAAMPQLLTSHGADFMSPGEYLANADFVAAANPAAVLALLDELAATESRLHEVAVLAANAEQERDQLKAENAELRRDAERYRYLRDGACTVALSRRELIVIEDIDAIPGDFENDGEMLNAALDQLIAKEQQP